MFLSYCVKEKAACVGWVEKYFKDCLCNLRDEISFGFGLISLVSWGVADIPQIITNFQTKSSHGVSLAFLLTWVVGDIFNLVGCLLEPATLPTQFYTALLYTASTVILVLQSIYYGYICTRWKFRNIKAKQLDQEEKNDISDSSSDDDEAPQVPTGKPASQPKPIPRSVGYGVFLATSLNLPRQSMGLMEVDVGFPGRKLLHEHGMENTIYGQWLGWLMAAIYVVGRIPQICLNIKRGSMEGLNPLMFNFALVGNLTYVGSIVVRTTEWEKIKPNMPWLLDATVCAALDLFIILQYIYYKYIRKQLTDGGNDHGKCIEANN